MATTFPPNREAELVTVVQNIAMKTTATPTVYSLTAAQATAFSALVAAFVSAYNLVQDKATRSPMNVTLKNVAKKSLLTDLQVLARIVQNAPTTTNAMRDALGLPQRNGTFTPIPIPTAVPVVEVVKTLGNVLTVGVHQQDGSKRSKPPGVYAVQLYSYVGPTAPNSIDAYRFEGTVTRTKFQVAFPATLPAFTKVWLTALFVNPRLQAGPASPPIAANLGTWAVQETATTKGDETMKIAA